LNYLKCTIRSILKDAEVYVPIIPGANRYKDPTREYDEKVPMSPAKIREHEPTAVKREMTERIVEPGQQGTSDPEKAREIARRSGMAKGTAGAEESDSE
jgi:hypothetical protein